MKKILIALDYDPPAQKIAETGYALAKALDAKVILLHVVSNAAYYSALNYSPIMGYDGFNNFDLIQQPDNFEALGQAAQNYLNTSKEHLGDESIETVVKDGDFGDAILDTATEMNVDIIVMGTHGRHGLDKIFMGSVAEKVLHKSSVPLFIIPTKKFEENKEN